MMSFTASAVPRLLACPASGALPVSEYKTQSAEEGNERHAEMEVAEKEDLPAVVRGLLQPGDEMARECAFAYDVATDTARELGHVDGRAYPTLGVYEVAGKVDLLIRGQRFIVVDYKGYEEVDHAEDNGQTLTYALMVARTYGAKEVMVVIVYLVGNRKPTVATLGALDLDAHAARLKRLHGDVLKAQRDPEPFLSVGRHCKYCPAFLACPRQKALQIDATSGALAMRVESLIPFADDNEAVRALDMLAQLKLLTTRLSAALYARASERSIPLPNGNFFGPHEKTGNTEIDADIAYEVVREKHGQVVADDAVKREVSQAGIERALKKIAPKGQLAALKESVMAEVRARNGTSNKRKTVIEEYKPKLTLVGEGVHLIKP